MQNITTTNLRIPDDDLRQYRVVAAELGISFNDLVLDVLKTNANAFSLQKKSRRIKSKLEYSLEQLPDLPQLVREAERSGKYQIGTTKILQKKHKDIGLSDEDSEIYE